MNDERLSTWDPSPEGTSAKPGDELPREVLASAMGLLPEQVDNALELLSADERRALYERVKRQRANASPDVQWPDDKEWKEVRR